jgi:hypothetical protein
MSIGPSSFDLLNNNFRRWAVKRASKCKAMFSTYVASFLILDNSSKWISLILVSSANLLALQLTAASLEEFMS